jgi:tRNA (guanine37-N1)-methyltransferase
LKINFVSLFPELIAPYFENSILKRAVDNGFIEVRFVNPRDFTTDKHNRADLPLIGGGAGMLMMSQPIVDSLKSISSESHTIAVSPVGKKFNQRDAIRLSKIDEITLLSGRYEGFDERVIENHVDEVFSIGDFILTGGELASLTIADAVSRNVDGVLGNSSSLQGESFENFLLEAPNFAKPVEFEGGGVPSEYLNGNHKKIESLRLELAERKTQFFRPDLYREYLVYKKGRDEK